MVNFTIGHHSVKRMNFTHLNKLENKRVGIIGAHSCGKTTLVNTLKKYVETNFISEIASKIPPDERLNLKSQLNILNMQIEEEKKYTSFISDRTVIDNLAYFTLVKEKQLNNVLSEEEEKYLQIHYDVYSEHMNNVPYDIIIFIDEILSLRPSPHRNFMSTYEQAFVYLKMYDMLQTELDILNFSLPVIYLSGNTRERLSILNSALSTTLYKM